MSTTDLARRQPTPAEIAVVDDLTNDQFQSEIVKILGEKYVLRFLSVARATISRNPELRKCTRESIRDCLFKSARLNLLPDGHFGHLIPYKQTATFIVDVKGLIELARRNGITVKASLVFSKDAFSYIEDDGSGQSVLRHEVNPFSDRGELVGVYSRAKWLSEGREITDYECMSMEQVEAIRKRSRAGNTGPWVTDFHEMVRKCPIRRHSKRLPLTVEDAAILNEVDGDSPDFDKPPITFTAPRMLQRPSPQPQEESQITPFEELQRLLKESQIDEASFIHAAIAEGIPTKAKDVDAMSLEDVNECLSRFNDVCSNLS